MPLLGFQEQFVEGVENGLDLLAGRPLRHMGVDPKLNALRAYRKRAIKVGDTRHLWHKQRAKGGTPGRRKLGEADCLGVCGIEITLASIAIDDERDPASWNLQSLASDDGFESFADMRAWFNKTHGLPFTGQLIRWGDLSE